jgi:glycosyltransferase involved in cell wall biosynthesis
MKRPTLALCIPAYRAETHLPRLLKTAREQEPALDEIIVCVDASPDGTADVARHWGATVLINESNLGCSCSKNRALAAATSDWVHFHDADDILLPGFTAEAHRCMTLPNPPDVVIMGFEYRDFETNELLATGIVDDTALAEDPIGFSIRHKLPNFGIYKRDVLVRLGGFDCDPSVLHNEDVAFHTKLAIEGCRFRASPIVTSINWRHGDSMHQRNEIACLTAHHVVMTRLAQRVAPKYYEQIAQNLWLAAQGLAIHGQWQTVRRVLADAQKLFAGVPSGQSRDFTFVCRLLPPHIAFRLRETLICWFKPHLRSQIRGRYVPRPA